MKYRNGAHEALAKRFKRERSEIKFGVDHRRGMVSENTDIRGYENPYLAIAESQKIVRQITPLLPKQVLKMLAVNCPSQNAVQHLLRDTPNNNLHSGTFDSLGRLLRSHMVRIRDARTTLKIEAKYFKISSTSPSPGIPNATAVKSKIRILIRPEDVTKIIPACKQQQNHKGFDYLLKGSLQHYPLIKRDIWLVDKKVVVKASPEVTERDNIHVRECEYVELPEVEKQSGYLAYCQTNEHLFKTITKTPHGARRSCETMIRNAVVANFS